VVCRWLCSAANWNKTADINWTQREQEITPHASRLIIGMGTEAPEFEICNIVTAVLLKILIFCDVTPYSCVCSARHFGGAYCLHSPYSLQYPQQNRYNAMILERSATTHPQQSHLSQYTGVVLTKVIFYFIMPCYEPTLIRNEHFSKAAESRFVGCILLCVSHIWICTKWTTSVYVRTRYFWTAEIRSPTQEHLVWTFKVE